jgi:hypothetical protein
LGGIFVWAAFAAWMDGCTYWSFGVREASRYRRFGLAESVWVGVLALGAVGVALAVQPIQSVKQNFYIPGTQPNQLTDPLIEPGECAACHGYYDTNHEPFYRWSHSMMAQSARDPVFHAAVAITEQDASYVGELCMRCHAPFEWLKNLVKFENDPQSPNYGKLLPFAAGDRIGVACHICHRMVDPIYQSGASPAVDLSILSGLSTGIPPTPHDASMVMDPQDRRRGPYDLNADWANQPTAGWPGYHSFLQSPFHRSSRMCATCHDVSTPHFTRQTNGSYTINAVGQTPAPNKYDQFPEQRTFSEWSQSLFASGPVALNGRFGGNIQAYTSCQDCHMQPDLGDGCALEPPHRTDLPIHNFNGANTWVLRGVRALYDDSETDMDAQGVEDSISRATAMLQAASDMQLAQAHSALNVRIINYTGHKLPTGYNEGRRMWINVKFRDANGNFLAERGAYDATTATLNEADTKVYEGKIGPDATLGALLSVPAAPAFRLAISNRWYKDNRIPPMGFTNAGMASVQAGNVPANLYPDGQYWDDTRFFLPIGARSAQVTVYYQTSTKEYMEFLRDGNTSDSRGLTAYNVWVAAGKSAPVAMDAGTIQLRCRCDWNSSGTLEVQDIFDFLNDWFGGNGDFNGDGTAAVQDIFDFLNCWFAACAGY